MLWFFIKKEYPISQHNSLSLPKKTRKMLKIGHRGAKGYEPENTLVAFEKAVTMGADGIELDVHLSLDGELIVMHDPTIDRTTNGKGHVNQLTLSQIKEFKINQEHEIPTLSDVLDNLNVTISINIELKSDKINRKTASAKKGELRSFFGL
jgi:glycerophosphoryl diester phosphodiesterase